MNIPPIYASGPAATLLSRDVIRAAGTDAESFLQGQLSQDISRLAPGESGWSFLLQPQGKVDAWLRVTRIDVDTFLLDMDSGWGDGALDRLNRFKLRTACEMVLETWQMLCVRGARSTDEEIPIDSGAEVVVPAAWPGVEGIDALGTHVSKPPGMAEATEVDLERLRIIAGVPAMGSELTAETIPAEAGIVQRSVSFTKGCFTGQELVARIDSRGGNVPRRLRGLVGAGDLRVGDSVVVAGAEVGVVTSAVGSVGLAYIKRSVESLPADAVAGDVEISVRELPLIQ